MVVMIYIDSFRVGGMHKQMLLLGKYINREKCEIIYCVQHTTGGLFSQFSATGLRIIDLGWKGKYDFNVILKLRQNLNILRPDVVLITEPQNLCYYLLARFFCKKPIRLVTSFRAMNCWKGHLNPWFMVIDNLLAILTICSGKKVVVNSKALEKRYTQLVPRFLRSKFLVIYNLIGENSAQKLTQIQARRVIGMCETDIVLVMVARLDPWKDFETLFRAIKILVSSRNDFKLYLIGGGELYDKNVSEIKRLKLESNIFMVGEVNEASIYIQAADISVLSTHGEGLSNTVIESMALAKPVIATNVGGNTELLEGVGVLVKPQCPLDLSNALLHLISSKSIREKYGALAHERFRVLFSTKAGVDKYVSAFKE
jgi:glycosyltransferase involved in cell wall biosynthesis